MVLPTLRSEARNLIARSGNWCSASTCRMISPTAPVAPTTATLGTTSGDLSYEVKENNNSSTINSNPSFGKQQPVCKYGVGQSQGQCRTGYPFEHTSHANNLPAGSTIHRVPQYHISAPAMVPTALGTGCTWLGAVALTSNTLSSNRNSPPEAKQVGRDRL